MAWRLRLTSWTALLVSLVTVVLVVVLDLAARLPDLLAARNGYRGNLGMFALDINLWPPQTGAILAAYGPAGRGAMIVTHVTLDMVLPAAYAVLGFNVLRRGSRCVGMPVSSLLLAAPIGAAFADVSENVLFVALALIYPSSPAVLVWAAAVATWAKFGLLSLSLGRILVIGCAVVSQHLRHRPPGSALKTAAGSVPWLAALAIIVVLLFGVDVEAAAAPPPQPGCMALLAVGLRGNGDRVSSDAGMGGDTHAVVDRLSRRLSHSGFVPVAYPYVTGTLPQIVAHIRSASRMLAAYLAGRASRCPAERLVVIGQSEGAAIIHLALPAVGRQVSAAVLLGDPARLAGAPYDSLHSAHNGILAWALLNRPGTLGGEYSDVLSASAEHNVRSYCLATDPVCDPGLTTELRGMRDGIHTSYRRSRIADSAAEFIVSRVQSTVLPGST